MFPAVTLAPPVSGLSVSLRLSLHANRHTAAKAAAQLNPWRAELHNDVGICQLDLDRPGDAVACFRRALDVWPDYPEAHGNLATGHGWAGWVDDPLDPYGTSHNYGWGEITIDQIPENAYTRPN